MAFLKGVFHKFYLLYSWILCSIYLSVITATGNIIKIKKSFFGLFITV